MTKSANAPFVFISYARADLSFVERLRTDLHEQGISAWVDLEEIQPGTADWEESLRMSIRTASAVLLAASPNARSSRYVKDELRIAEMYQRPVYPLWIAGKEWMEAVPIGWGSMQYIDAREEHYTKALDDLVKVLSKLNSFDTQGFSSAQQAALTEQPRNPYKGLQAF